LGAGLVHSDCVTFMCGEQGGLGVLCTCISVEPWDYCLSKYLIRTRSNNVPIHVDGIIYNAFNDVARCSACGDVTARTYGLGT